MNTTPTNVDSRACPYGAGAYRYLTLDTDTINSLILHTPRQHHMPSGSQGSRSQPSRLTNAFDFLEPRTIGAPCSISPTASYTATPMAWPARAGPPQRAGGS